MTYYYLGNIHAIQGNQAQAREDYRACAGARSAQRTRERSSGSHEPLDDSHRSERPVPHSGRRRRHRNLSPKSAASAGRYRLREPIHCFYQSGDRRRSGAGPAQLRARAAARPRQFPPGAHPLGAVRAAVCGAQTSAQCFVQSRIHRAAAVRLPDGHRVSRSAAQAASGIFSLVRSAVLEFLRMGLGAAVARSDRRLPSHRRRSGTLLRPLRAGDPSRRGARVHRNRPTPPPQEIICCASPPRIRTKTWSGCCAYMLK